MGCLSTITGEPTKALEANPKSKRIPGFGLAKSGYLYDVPADRLPEVLRGLADHFSFKLEQPEWPVAVLAAEDSDIVC
jgi:hypothetical protein